MSAARIIYEYTSIPKSVALGAFSIAVDMGYQEEIDLCGRRARPYYLPEGDPARLLSERFRRQEHRTRRREMVADWTLLVHAFNLQLEGKTAVRLQVSAVWPRVAEASAEYASSRQQAISYSRTLPRNGGLSDNKTMKSRSRWPEDAPSPPISELAQAVFRRDAGCVAPKLGGSSDGLLGPGPHRARQGRTAHGRPSRGTAWTGWSPSAKGTPNQA